MHSHQTTAPDPRIGRLVHPPGQRLERHGHELAHITVVLTGRFGEAGDFGRRDLGPGEVVLRRSFDPHFNLIGSSGATVLVLPQDRQARSTFGRVRDPELLVRLAERNPVDALDCLDEQIEPLAPVDDHWSDLLASLLRDGWAGSLADWADEVGCRPETLSREFRKIYGCSPRQYRVAIRSRAALMRIRRSTDALAAIAADLGFADQSHMNRAVRELTGATPLAIRRRSGSGRPAASPWG